MFRCCSIMSCVRQSIDEGVSEQVNEIVREVCLGIAERDEMSFLESGTDRNHMHFLIQSVPTYSPTKIVQTLKSLTARHVLRVRRR